MAPAAEDDREGNAGPLPTTLHIDFAAGERPHRFWVSDWTRATSEGAHERSRYKILSKRHVDRSLEVLVLEEVRSGRVTARRLARIPPTTPSGWLTHWVEKLASDLDISFHPFDLSDIESVEEWRHATRRLGWSMK